MSTKSRINVSVSSDAAEYFRKLGSGNLSEGLRVVMVLAQAGTLLPKPVPETKPTPEPKKSHPDSVWVSRDEIVTGGIAVHVPTVPADESPESVADLLDGWG